MIRDKIFLLIFLFICFLFFVVEFNRIPWLNSFYFWIELGSLFGFLISYIVHSRIEYHNCYGILTSSSLNIKNCRNYKLTLYAFGIVILSLCVVIYQPSMFLVGVLSYILEIVLSYYLSNLFKRYSCRINNISKTLKALPNNYIFCVINVIISIVVSFLIYLGGYNHTYDYVACSFVFSLPFLFVDYSVVKFMSSIGYRSKRIILYNIRGILSYSFFMGIFLFLLNEEQAIISIGVFLFFILLKILYVLLYRIYTKKISELILMVIAGMIALFLYTTPLVCPIVVFLLLWKLNVLGNKKIWLMT